MYQRLNVSEIVRERHVNMTKDEHNNRRAQIKSSREPFPPPTRVVVLKQIGFDVDIGKSKQVWRGGPG